VDERIRPALAAGMIVLCDRFADSTTAYQGAGRAIAEETVLALHQTATRGVWPDLTIVIDLPVEVGLARATQAQRPDRLESEPVEFHRRVRDGFLRIAQREPNRVKVVDGTQPIDEVYAAIWNHVAALLSDSMEAP
jgi:dTMP kinase